MTQQRLGIAGANGQHQKPVRRRNGVDSEPYKELADLVLKHAPWLGGMYIERCLRRSKDETSPKRIRSALRDAAGGMEGEMKRLGAWPPPSRPEMSQPAEDSEPANTYSWYAEQEDDAEFEEYVHQATMELLRDADRMGNDITLLGNYPIHRAIAFSKRGKTSWVYLYVTARVPIYRRLQVIASQEFNTRINGELIHKSNVVAVTQKGKAIIRSTRSNVGEKHERSLWARAVYVPEHSDLHVRTYVFDRETGKENPETYGFFRIGQSEVPVVLTENEYDRVMR